MKRKIILKEKGKTIKETEIKIRNIDLYNHRRTYKAGAFKSKKVYDRKKQRDLYDLF